MSTVKSHDNLLSNSLKIRESLLNLQTRKIRIANLVNSEQERDLSLPPVCKGFGRIHHFRRSQGEGWPSDPLPIDPASNALGLPFSNEALALVFQCAACNIQCWYCYVDRRLICSDPKYSEFLSVNEMLDMYLSEHKPPKIIDLSGGQPDLAPEWALWFSDLIFKNKLSKKIYLWSDDNLTDDFLWRFLTKEQIHRLASYKNYGRVGCFKGFDKSSFAFNTGASAELFDRQFIAMRKIVQCGIDVYGYATFTTNNDKNLASRMASFVDRIQTEIHPLFPLRIVPQRIYQFTPNKIRFNSARSRALKIQNEAVYWWKEEIGKRFSENDRKKRIFEHRLDTSIKL